MQLAAPVSAEGHEDEGRGVAPSRLASSDGQAVERREEAVHERGIGLDGLLAGRAAQMGRAEEIHVRV